MIDLTLHPQTLERSIQRARERHIFLPTFEMMKNPQLIPASIQDQLGGVGLWDINPLNLSRITWHNEPKLHGGRYGGVNFVEIPRAITGINARIFTLIGKWFPTGAHKVGQPMAALRLLW